MMTDKNNVNENVENVSNQKESNRERFVRIAEARTQRIIDLLELLGNCSNPYNYEYTQKDVEKMYAAIEEAVKRSKAKYAEPKKKESKFKF